jgi:hypothetical protein
MLEVPFHTTAPEEYFPQTIFKLADFDPAERGFATTLSPEQEP